MRDPPVRAYEPTRKTQRVVLANRPVTYGQRTLSLLPSPSVAVSTLDPLYGVRPPAAHSSGLVTHGHRKHVLQARPVLPIDPRQPGRGGPAALLEGYTLPQRQASTVECTRGSTQVRPLTLGQTVRDGLQACLLAVPACTWGKAWS